MLFDGFETYLAFLHSTLFFSGISLLFFMCYLITKSNVISFVASLLFTSSTIWFYGGDIFAFIPLGSAEGKIISLVYYYFILILVFSLRMNYVRFLIITFLSGAMLWLHSITFLAPGIATIFAYYIIMLFKREYGFKKNVMILIMCLVIIMLSGLPHMFLHKTMSKANQMNLSAEISNVDREMILSDLKKEGGYRMYNPLRLHHYKWDFQEIKGYKLLFYLSLFSLLFIGNDERIRFLIVSAIIYFLFTLFVLEINYLSNYRLKLEFLTRNAKWLYFYLFLLFLAPYSNFRSIITARNKHLVAVLNVFICILLIHFFSPHIKRSFTHNTIIHKSLEKTELGRKITELYPKFRDNEFFQEAIKFCPGEKNVGIIQINKDANELANFIKEIPPQYNFIGPAWLRYKAGANLSFNIEDGLAYLWRADSKYIEWKKQNTAWGKIYNVPLGETLDNRYLKYMYLMDGDFFVIEKFKKSFVHEENRYSFGCRKIDLKGFPLIYENNSFSIIDLREEADRIS